MAGTSLCFSRAWYNLLHVHKIKMATAQNFISPNIAKYFSTFSRCIHLELFNPAYYSNSLLLALSISSISQLSPIPLPSVYLGPRNMKITTTSRVLNEIIVGTAPKIFFTQENSQWGWHNTLMVFHRIGFPKYIHKYCSLITKWTKWFTHIIHYKFRFLEFCDCIYLSRFWIDHTHNTRTQIN